MTEPPHPAPRRRLSLFQLVIVGLFCAFLLVVAFGALSVIRDVAALKDSARQTREALADLKSEVAESVAKVDREVGRVAALPHAAGRAGSTPRAP